MLRCLRPHLYEYRDKDAVSHLFRMAASLDSMVVGEPQILGQVKEAFAVARAAGTVAGQLDHLLQSAFAAAKKARSRDGHRLEFGFHCFGGRGHGAQDFRLAARAHGFPGGRGQDERAGGAAPGAAGRGSDPGDATAPRSARAAWPRSFKAVPA